jgi:AbrB family looped-hinge helix DNA binding protein
MKATVTSKGQITIPLPIREKLGLSAGKVVDFDASADLIRPRKRPDLQRMSSVIGLASRQLPGKSALQWLDEMRGPVDIPRKRKRK